MRFNEELRQYLESVSFAMLCLTLDLGEGEEVIIVVKSTKELVDKLKDSAAPVRLGWVVEPSEHGPVLGLCMECHKEDVGELMGECYLDPLNIDDLDMLEELCTQPGLKVAFFNEEMDIGWVAQPRWTMIDRLYAEQSVDKARALSEKTSVPDFEKAMEHFKEAVSMERIEMSFLEPDEAAQ